jgi:hypothetical protein
LSSARRGGRDRLYVCRIAPAASTWKQAIRSGHDVLKRGALRRESFAPWAFGDAVDVPVLLDHDRAREVGKVVGVTDHDQWILASIELDQEKPLASIAADRLAHGAALSPTFVSLLRDELLEQTGVAWHKQALLREVSILEIGDRPAYEGTGVMSRLERSTRSPAASPDRLAAAGEVIRHPRGVLLRRPGIGQVIGVR